MPAIARRALAQGAEVIFVWGGDGTVQLGRLAYLYAGARNLTARRVKAIVDVDGSRFFKGGARAEVTKMRIKVHPGSIKICVPN
jgi:hypothetical protein